MKTQSEVDAELARLEGLIPDLIAQYPAEQVLEAFAGEAEVLREQPPAGMEQYVAGKINAMLAAAGLIPGE